MGRLSLVGTFYARHEQTLPLLRRVLVESTRPPDEFWIMCEGADDADIAMQALDFLDRTATVVVLPTPRLDNGRYAVVPYSNKINYALDRTDADYIAYLTNDSMPDPRKYELMARALAENPDWHAVYCGQRRNGSNIDAVNTVPDGWCVLDHTQVMHRATHARWTLDPANTLLGDAYFWRDLNGPFQPVEGGILDVTDQTADGLTRGA